MASASSLKQQAASIAASSRDSQVQELARIVEQLCDCVQYADREARDATVSATRAGQDARDAMRGAKK
jgi:hypothetical protein